MSIYSAQFRINRGFSEDLLVEATGSFEQVKAVVIEGDETYPVGTEIDLTWAEASEALEAFRDQAEDEYNDARISAHFDQ